LGGFPALFLMPGVWKGRRKYAAEANGILPEKYSYCEGKNCRFVGRNKEIFNILAQFPGFVVWDSTGQGEKDIFYKAFFAWWIDKECVVCVTQKWKF